MGPFWVQFWVQFWVLFGSFLGSHLADFGSFRPFRDIRARTPA